MDKTSTPTLIVLLGPTGVGKTEISLKLAEFFQCPIVSSDSRQLYRELKIGTAAPSEDELKRVPHYFIGSHSVFDLYSAGQYELDAINLLHDLFKKHNVVLLVGGSMMYIDAVCNGIDAIPTVDPSTRQHWLDVYAENGLDFIQQELKRLDPIHYDEVDLKNAKRVLHALEICSITGRPFSEIRTGKKKDRDFRIIKIGFKRDREELYARINQRVDVMMSNGLLEEAARYFDHRDLNTLNTVGYKELYAYMDGTWTLDYAVNMIRQDSRHYAKKQLSWFNRDHSIYWYHPDQHIEIFEFLTSELTREPNPASID